MNISGRFGTSSSLTALQRLENKPEELARVSTLEDVSADDTGVIRARFVPGTAMGRLVLRVRITVVSRDDRGARLRVVGQHGNHLVDVDLALVFAPSGDGGEITWDADVVVRGPVASVGQRVARDLAQRVVGDVLREAAEVAGQPV